MKKITTFLFTLVLTVSVLSQGMTVFAESTTISVVSVQANAGTTVAVPIQLTNNQGVYSLYFDLSYDKKIFKVKEVRNSGDVFPSNAILLSPFENPVLTFYADNGNNFANNNKNGTVATVYFEVSKDALPGSYDLSLKNDDPGQTIDSDGNEVLTIFKAGIIQVVKKKVNNVITNEEAGKVIPTNVDQEVDSTDSTQNQNNDSKTNSNSKPNSNVTPTQSGIEIGSSTISSSDELNNTQNTNLTPYILIAIAVLGAIILVYFIIKSKKKIN